MKDKYYSLKHDFNKSIILIKSGVFYVTYDIDAYILHNIFNYQVKNNRLGFPIKIIDTVKMSLDDAHINYVIFDNTIVEDKRFDNNKYDEHYQENKRMEYVESSKELLLNRIKFLIDNSEDDYDKIRRFINEL